LLPLEMRKEQEALKSAKYGTDEPNAYKAFIYSDSTVSDAVIPSKMDIRFDNCRDSSGFDWNTGYSPDYQVKKDEWTAGFNKKGVWEKVFTIPAQNTIVTENQSANPAVSSAGKKSGDNIRVLQYKDTAYLFDASSFLCDGMDEYFYSVTGEIYGARQVDRKKSLERLTDSLKQKGIKKLTGIVVKSNDKKTVQYYKKELKSFISKKTAFYTQTDSKLYEKTNELLESLEGEAVSREMLSDIIELSTRGVKGEDLYNSLLNASHEAYTPIPLDIFNNPADMDTFFLLPSVREVCEAGTEAYVRELDIDSEKSRPLSHAVQNILNNYSKIFKFQSVNQREIIQAAREFLVDGKSSSPLLDMKLTSEQTLADIITAALNPGSKKDMNSVFKTSKENDTYYDIFTDQGQKDWAEEELQHLLPGDTINSILDALKTIRLPDSEQNRISLSVQNIMPQYQAIKESTGMKPGEIISLLSSMAGIAGTVPGKQGTEQLLKKRVFFEKSVKDIIQQSSAISPEPVKTEKSGHAIHNNIPLVWKPFSEEIDFFNSDELDAVLTSPLIKESGLSLEESEEIRKYVHTVQIPDEDKIALSRGLLNVIRGYNLQLRPAGISLNQALSALSDIVESKGNTPDNRTFRLVNKAAGIKEFNKISLSADLADTDSPAFSFNLAALLKEAEVPEKDAGQVFDYLKNLSLSPDKLPVLSRGMELLLSDSSQSAEINAGVLDMVKGFVSVLKGDVGDLPEHIKKSVSEAFKKSTQELRIAGKTDTVPLNETIIPGYDSLNFSSDKELALFLNSDFFNQTGLGREQFESLYSTYMNEYLNANNRTNKNTQPAVIVPVVYSEVIPPAPQQLFVKPEIISTADLTQGGETGPDTIGFIVKSQSDIMQY
jgi:hypothetical protein